MTAVMSAVRAVLPAAFEPFGEADDVDEDEKLPMAAEDETGENAADNSAAVLAAEAMMSIQQGRRQHERHRKVQEIDLEQDPHVAAATLTALLPLLSKLPPLCPPSERPTALPALLLLSARVLGAASMLNAPENGMVSGSTSSSHHKAWRTGMGRGNSGAGGAEAEAEVGVSTTSPEACAAVEFVRSCVTEVWRHGDTGRAAADSAVGEAAAQGMGGLEMDCKADGADDTGRVNRPQSDGISEAPKDYTVEGDATAASEAVPSAGVDRVDNRDGDDDDDWGDEDFQGADDAPPHTLEGAGVDSVENGSADSAVVTGQVPEVAGESSPEESGDDRDTTAADISPHDKEGQGDQAGVIPLEIEEVADSKRGDSSDGGGDAVVEEAGNEEEGADASPGVAAGSDDGPGDGEISTGGGEEDPTASTSDVVVVPSAADEDGKEPDGGIVTHAQKDTGNDEQSSSEHVPTLVVETASASARSEVTAASPANNAESTPRNGIVADNADDGSPAAVAAAAAQKLPPPVPSASALVQGVGNMLNKLLKYHLSTRAAIAVSSEQEGGICVGRRGSTEAIGAATEAWGAVALAVPSAAPSLAPTLQSALSAPADECSVTERLALFRGVGVTVKAAQEAQDSTGQMQDEGGSRGPSAAASLLRLLVPYALAGLRTEVARAATAVEVGEAGTRENEPHEACLLEGVHIAQLALKVRFSIASAV